MTSHLQAGFFAKLFGAAAISSASILTYQYYQNKNASIKHTIQKIYSPYVGQWHKEQATAQAHDAAEHLKQREWNASMQSGQSAIKNYWNWMYEKIKP
jgi:hypothetical protein